MSQPEGLADQRYFHLHGLKAAAPERLNDALKAAIDEQKSRCTTVAAPSSPIRRSPMLRARAGVDLDNARGRRGSVARLRTESRDPGNEPERPGRTLAGPSAYAASAAADDPGEPLRVRIEGACSPVYQQRRTATRAAYKRRQ